MAIGAFDSDAFDVQAFSEDAFLFEESGVIVPDVVGQSQAAGTATLEGDGFAVAVETAHSSSVPAGEIISQVPAGGVEAVSGSTVTITVSLGDAPAAADSGAGKSRRRRRWQAEKDGVVREFDSAEQAIAFVREAAEELKPKVRKPGRPRKILPPIELFYGDTRVTDFVLDDKPVIEWFVSTPDIQAIEAAILADEAEDDEILNSHMEDMAQVRAYLQSLRRMFGR